MTKKYVDKEGKELKKGFYHISVNEFAYFTGELERNLPLFEYYEGDNFKFAVAEHPEKSVFRRLKKEEINEFKQKLERKINWLERNLKESKK